MNLHSTVLIVDDNDLNRETLEMLLTNQGYNLESACNGFEGLEKTRELEPDLILLDVMMPDIDGFEVCRRIRADSILGEIPIILVTALDDRESRLEGIEAGADDFITKPYDRVELRTRVRTITRLNRFRRLMSERTKFEWVIDQADEGYLAIADAGQINYANKQARLYLNLPPDGDLPITETFQALVGRQYRLEPDSAWESWPQTPTIDADQKRYLVRPETLTATAFWLEVDILHLDASTKNQNDATWIIKLKDVTKSMAITQNMWEFGAMVSHKLRTPLIGMLSGMELLTQFGTDLSQAEMVQLAEQALRGVRRLRSEIDGILHYMGATRVSGKGSDERIFVKQLPAMIETICTETDISKAYIHHIEGEQSQLKISVHSMELILREILENSKIFHPHQKPAITITIKEIMAANKIKITITDDGIHLSPEQLAKALIPYYQGEKYFTGEAKGMGLGLSMVASSVWSIGGTCKMFNRDDTPGVVVELTLPISRKLRRLANRIAEKKK